MHSKTIGKPINGSIKKSDCEPTSEKYNSHNPVHSAKIVTHPASIYRQGVNYAEADSDQLPLTPLIFDFEQTTDTIPLQVI